MTHTAKQRNLAILQMAMCAGLWSIAGIFIKLIPWHPMAIAGFRSLLAGAVVLAYIKIRGWRFVLNKQTLLSGVFLCITFCTFVVANKLTTAANAIVLEFTSPVFIVILSALLFGQKFGRADLITVALTLGGISLFFFDQLTPGGMIGNFVALSAGLFQACTYIFVGNCHDNDRMSGILIGHFLTALVGIPFAFFSETAIAPLPVLSILVLGILQLGIPYVLFGEASRVCPPLMCSLIGAVEPLLNPVWVFLFDGERPGTWALVGGVIVIVTITLWCMQDGGTTKEATA